MKLLTLGVHVQEGYGTCLVDIARESTLAPTPGLFWYTMYMYAVRAFIVGDLNACALLFYLAKTTCMYGGQYDEMYMLNSV